MSRNAKGSIQRSADGKSLKVRVTIKDDQGQTYRPWLELDPRFSDDTARRIALRAAADRQGKPREELAPQGTAGLTCDEYFTKLWAPSRAGKVKSLSDDEGRWRNHVRRLIGDKAIADVTADDLRGVVEFLDAKASSPAFPRFNHKSAVNCWAVVAKMFDDACNSKLAKLRLLKTNPAADVQPPDPPGEIEKQWLFPNELQQLLACPRVPLGRRRLYAAAVYCYSRPGETLALLWRAGIDLEHGMVRINRAWDSRQERYNEYTKTGDSRHFALEPVLRPMFEAMFRRRRTEFVFPPLTKLAETLRADLLEAGVSRPALHVPKPGAELMRFHDLRATGITYMAMRGDTDNAVRERAGHTDFQTTLMYIRRGHLAAGASIGQPFQALPDELLGIVLQSSGGGFGGPESSGSDSKSPETATVADAGGPPQGFKSLLPLQKSATASSGYDEEKKSGDDSPDDSFRTALLTANAERGRKLAALAEADPESAGPGLAFCRAYEQALVGDGPATLDALADAAQALGLTGGGR